MNAAKPAAAEISMEPFQLRAWNALIGRATNVLIYGGSGSGKTHLILLWLVLRAICKPKTTHAIFRFRFNHLRGTIIDNTLPKVCETYWPGQKLYTLNRSEWCAEFVNGSRLYFGGLDDKSRTEKVLGMELSSIYCNETSQISHSAWLKACTRLRQQSGLQLKFVCDENPPQSGHWTEKLWIRGVEPSSGAKISDPADYVAVKMNPADSPHIDEGYKRRLQNQPARERDRFWLGNFGQATADALWTYESIGAARVDAVPPGVSLTRTLVAIDPSGCHGPEDKRSDEVGMVTGALGDDGVVYVLEDASGRFAPGGKDGWGARGIRQYLKHSADAIIGEKNFGGAMVGHVIQSASVDGMDGANVSFREVSAAQGKSVRAEPVSTLTNVGKVKFVGHFPELEEQLLGFSTAGYLGDRSPDHADAFVWMVHALGVTRQAGQHILEYYKRQVEALPGAAKAPATETATDAAGPPVDGAALVAMLAPARFAVCSTFTSVTGKAYALNDGRAFVAPGEVAELATFGFVAAP